MKNNDDMLINKTDMIWFQWIQGVSLIDHIRNKEIRKAATVNSSPDNSTPDTEDTASVLRCKAER